MTVADIVMPQCDGYEATERIRKMNVLAPIVITTANQIKGNPKEEAHVHTIGANDILQKPFGREELKVVLRRFGLLSPKTP